MVELTLAERLARAVLLFYATGPWDAEKHLRWMDYTGNAEATTHVLCDLTRDVRKSEEERRG